MAEIYYKNGSVYEKLAASDMGAAAASHTHAASDVGSGTLSSDVLPVVPVSKGGTGATTKEGAAANLSVMTLSRRTRIPANSDLNDYTTIGCYSCNSNADGQTISNIPDFAKGMAFTLDVSLPIGTGYIQQTLRIYNTGCEYVRILDPYSDNAWMNWYRKFDTSTKVPIANGGTNATTAEQARANLEAAKRPAAHSSNTVLYALRADGTEGSRLFLDDLDPETDSGNSTVPSVRAVNKGLATKVNKLTPGYAAAYTVAADGTQGTTKLGSTATGNGTDIMQRSGVQAMIPNPIPVSQGGTGATTELDACNSLMAAFLNPGAPIGSGENLNAYKDSGTFYIKKGATWPINSPELTSSGNLYVLKFASMYVIQLIISVDGAHTNIYSRSLTGGMWSEWIHYRHSREIIEIGGGGTGGVTASQARENLGAAKKPEISSSTSVVYALDANGTEGSRTLSDSMSAETDSRGSIIPTVKAVNAVLNNKVSSQYVQQTSLYGRTIGSNQHDRMYPIEQTYNESLADPEHKIYSCKAINEGLQYTYVKTDIGGTNKIYALDNYANVVGLPYSQYANGNDTDILTRIGVMRTVSKKISLDKDNILMNFLNKGDNLDTLKTPGQYAYQYSDGATALVNCPNVGNFRLLVMDPASYNINTAPLLVQVIIDSFTGGVYTRRYDHSWSVWKRLAFIDEAGGETKQDTWTVTESKSSGQFASLTVSKSHSNISLDYIGNRVSASLQAWTQLTGTQTAETFYTIHYTIPYDLTSFGMKLNHGWVTYINSTGETTKVPIDRAVINASYIAIVPYDNDSVINNVKYITADCKFNNFSTNLTASA